MMNIYPRNKLLLRVEQPIKKTKKSKKNSKKNKKKVVFDPTCQLIVWKTGLAFEMLSAFEKLLLDMRIQEHVELDKYVNNATRVR
ncbi:hypothetical protein H5410_053461 [Solanum commersonii]|uniref:Uncharacterized protein n=1 Tax=Solanum commersonii TaxID=4109 RepID=A0A9J5X4I4_SOLCO|nr:hypothetical protein H5410_053461 [Solanum commersonii]